MMLCGKKEFYVTARVKNRNKSSFLVVIGTRDEAFDATNLKNETLIEGRQKN
jgi:hypothetical protein